MLRFFRQLLLTQILLCMGSAAFADSAASNSAVADSARINVIKAGLVNGFTTYTTWPESDTTLPFVIGVMGEEDNFIPALQRFFEKKPVFNDRSVKIKAVQLEDILDCQVLVVLGDANGQADAIIEKVAHLPILTISDKETFTQSGGHVNFYNENNKLRFAVNWTSTTNSNLKISSRLLRLARVVGKNQ